MSLKISKKLTSAPDSAYTVLATLAEGVSSDLISALTPETGYTFKLERTLPGKTFEPVIVTATTPATSFSTGGITIPAGATPILIIDGQSNATGVNHISDFNATTHSLISPDPLDEFQNVRIQDYDRNTLMKMRWGYTFAASGSDGFGSEIGFAQRWETTRPSQELVIVKRGWPGQSLTNWAAGAIGYTSLVATVNAAKAALVAEGKTPFVIGMLWNQWESDNGQLSEATYDTDLADFFDRLVADDVIETTTRKVIIGKSTSTIYAKQEAFVAADTDAVLVDTNDFPGNAGDTIHYTGRSQYLIGFSEVYNKLFGLTTAYPFPLIPTTSGLTYTRNTATNSNGKPVSPAGASISYTSDYWLYFGPFTYGTATGGSFYTNDAHSFVEINTNATGFTFKSAKIGLAQKLNFFLDNVYHGSLDETTFSGSDIEYAITGLTAGTHTIRIEPKDGAYLVLCASRQSTTVNNFVLPAASVAGLDASNNVLDTSGYVLESSLGTGIKFLGNQLTDATRPSVNATGINGQPALVFADHYVYSESNINLSDRTEVIVSQIIGPSSASYNSILGSDDANDFLFYDDGNYKLFIGGTPYNSGIARKTVPTIAIIKYRTVVTGGVTSYTAQVKINGESGPLHTVPAIAVNAPAYIGRPSLYNSNGPLNGKVGFVDILGATATNTEIDDLENSLKTRFGITY